MKLKMFNLHKKRENGWLAITVHQGGAEAALIERSADSEGLPRVQRLDIVDRSSDKAAAGGAWLAQEARRLGWEDYRCTTTLKPGDYQLLQAPVPDVDAAEVKQAVRWQMGDALEFPADSATFDVLDIPLPDHLATRGRSLWVAAAPNAVIQQVMNTFDAAGLDLQAIDLPELAQRNLAHRYAEPGRGVAMLYVGEDGALLTFTYEGDLYGVRRIDVTGAQLAEGDATRRATLVERIGLELQRSLDNFERLYSFVGITRVLLAPCRDGVALADELRSFLYIPLDLVDLAQVLDLSAVPALADPILQGRHFVTLGAALRADA